MERVTGIGGVFFRSADPGALRQWYRDHLGLPDGTADDETVVFTWRSDDHPEEAGSTVWAPFESDTGYFGRRENEWMLNFRVADLDAMLAQLRSAGAVVHDGIEEMEGFGRFGWFDDPEGNRIELWEPPSGM